MTQQGPCPNLHAPSTAAPVGRPRQHRVHVEQAHGLADCHEEALQKSQKWIDARFTDLAPEDLCPDGVHIFTAQKLRAPHGFQSIWGIIECRHRVGEVPFPEEVRTFRAVQTVLLLADIADKEQVHKAMRMADFIADNLAEDAPLLILVKHSVGQELQKPIDEDVEMSSIAHACEHVDDIIITEFEGTRFAWEVLNKVNGQSAWIQKAQLQQRRLEERTHEREDSLEWAVHDTFWDYCRRRLNTCIPAMNCSIATGEPKHISDYQLGDLLGKGACGRVHQLLRLDGEPAGSVLKVVKKPMSVSSLRCVHRQVQVMQILSEDHPHPNVTKLYDMFHSETHLFYQIEDGGPANLFKCLENHAQRQAVLPINKSQAILSQLMSAVRHLHQTANVVHRDIKPENIIVSDTENDITIKLADFDTAEVDPKVPSSGLIGTFPFSAPEIVLERAYDPFAADIWSMGVVSLEVVCFLQVMEQSLQLDGARKADIRAQHRRIRRFFSEPQAVNRILANIRPELQPMMSNALLLTLQNVLNVDAGQRWRAGQAYGALEGVNLERA